MQRKVYACVCLCVCVCVCVLKKVHLQRHVGWDLQGTEGGQRRRQMCMFAHMCNCLLIVGAIINIRLRGQLSAESRYKHVGEAMAIGVRKISVQSLTALDNYNSTTPKGQLDTLPSLY